jgi:hypothetical protein
MAEKKTVTMEKTKDTKNKVRFGSDDDEVPTLYIGKDTVKALGNPESIRVTVTAA